MTNNVDNIHTNDGEEIQKDRFDDLIANFYDEQTRPPTMTLVSLANDPRVEPNDYHMDLGISKPKPIVIDREALYKPEQSSVQKKDSVRDDLRTSVYDSVPPSVHDRDVDVKGLKPLSILKPLFGEDGQVSNLASDVQPTSRMARRSAHKEMKLQKKTQKQEGKRRWVVAKKQLKESLSSKQPSSDDVRESSNSVPNDANSDMDDMIDTPPVYFVDKFDDWLTRDNLKKGQQKVMTVMKHQGAKLKDYIFK